METTVHYTILGMTPSAPFRNKSTQGTITCIAFLSIEECLQLHSCRIIHIHG